MGRKSQVEIRKGHRVGPEWRGLRQAQVEGHAEQSWKDRERHRSPGISDPHRHREAERKRRSGRRQRKAQQESRVTQRTDRHGQRQRKGRCSMTEMWHTSREREQKVSDLSRAGPLGGDSQAWRGFPLPWSCHSP